MGGQALKKLGILGGTFNPIHVGHLTLAEWAMEEFSLDHVLFIPSGCSYMKRENGVLNSAERLQMVNLAVEDRDDFSCSDMEIRRGGCTYTFETLYGIRQRLPGTELYFIVGADSLFSIEYWRHPEKIFECGTLVAAARYGADMDRMEQKRLELEGRFHGRVRLMEFLSMEISSSEIRRRVRENKSIRYLVPEKVRGFIEETGLYADGTETIF